MSICYLSESYVYQRAEALLKEHYLTDVPVDLELLIERRLGLDIIPIPGFQHRFGVDGVLSQDLTRISVDSGMMQNVQTRYRFTLAHELGHLVLHGDVIKSYFEDPVDEHLMLWETLTSDEYKRAEWQANRFASAILMPSWHLQTGVRDMAAKLAEQKMTFSDLDDYAKMKVIRAHATTYNVSPDALRIRLITEGLIPNFENPERGGIQW